MARRLLKKRIGEMLIEEGHIDAQTLPMLLEESKKQGLKLGQYVIKKGYITEQKLLDVLSRKLGFEIYDPAIHMVEDGIEHLLPVDYALKFNAVPLFRQGSLLNAVFIDPTDILALDQVERITDLEVNPLLCTYQDFYKLYSTLYKRDPYQNVLQSNQEESAEEAETAVEEHDEHTTDIDESALMHMVQDVPVIRLVNSLLSIGVNESASDIHISPKPDRIQVRLRVDGKLHEVESPPKRMYLPMVSRIKILAGLDISVRRVPQDGRFTVKLQNKEINIRVSSIPTAYGEKVVLRLLDMGATVRTLESLGMTKSLITKVREAIALPYGMYLATGPTGSGKSTTLYAIINEVISPEINVVTLEDPIEYRFDNVEQVQLNSKAGMTFASGLRSILRQDPDVIMVGEIRDLETAEIATHAALTGHKVLSTVHTNDAVGAIVRFLDMGVEPFLISSMLALSIGQRLLRRICPNCKESYAPPKNLVEAFGKKRLDALNLKHGKGCQRCFYTGYLGRVGAYEVLLVDSAVRELINRQASSDEIVAAAVENQGFRSMRIHALQLVKAGVTTLEEVLRTFPNPWKATVNKVAAGAAGAVQPLQWAGAELQQPGAVQVQPQQPKELRPLRILVVDDDEDMQMFLKTVLEEAYYDVHLASDAKTAMDSLCDVRPDLVLVDYYMPGMDGVSLIESFKRSLNGAGNLRTIMLTASDMAETEVRSLEAGADDWLAKPITPERLLARVKRTLRFA